MPARNEWAHVTLVTGLWRSRMTAMSDEMRIITDLDSEPPELRDRFQELIRSGAERLDELDTEAERLSVAITDNAA